MDNRLIFLYPYCIDGFWRRIVVVSYGLRLKYSRWDERGKTRDLLTLRYDTNKYYLTIHASKKRSLVKIGPVPKPTQVDGLSILRWARELLLRNSAKWIRNFGIRIAYYPIGDKPQWNGPSDCLSKTQVYAKPQGDVYGLTPARCWKVKRRS